ncbi:MAG: hypothetical protein J7513_03905 [Solirubrobacteraceae bacterium]|nr:hypothetical protein [Solirubrobacteraceae bacterium]
MLAAGGTTALAMRLAGGGAVAAGLNADSLTRILTRALRGDDIVVLVLLDRQVARLRLLASRGLQHAARRGPLTDVDAPPGDPRRAPLVAALDLVAATMRRRSAAMWQALDALDDAAGNAERAAGALGCSGQSIRKHRARAHAEATTALPALFEALLSPPASGSREDARAAARTPAGTKH